MKTYNEDEDVFLGETIGTSLTNAKFISKQERRITRFKAGSVWVYYVDGEAVIRPDQIATLYQNKGV